MLDYIGWSLTALALVGAVLNAQMKVSGFLIWIVSNTGFLVINVIKGIPFQVAFFLANILICLRGLYVWNKKRKNVPKSCEESPS